MARHPNPAADCRRARRCHAETSASIVLGIGSERAIRLEERQRANRAPPACRRRRPRAMQCRASAAPRRSRKTSTRGLPRRRGLAERLGAALAQRRQHALDMLAGAEAVDAMIDAAAGIGEAVEAADLHLVEAAAPRLRAERAEKRMLGFQRLDGDDLGAAPPAAQRDLVLVGRRPKPCGGAGLSSAAPGLFGRARFFRAQDRGGRRLCTSGDRIAGCHGGTVLRPPCAGQSGDASRPPPISP